MSEFIGWEFISPNNDVKIYQGEDGLIFVKENHVIATATQEKQSKYPLPKLTTDKISFTVSPEAKQIVIISK